MSQRESVPTVIGLPAVLVAKLIGVTLLPKKLVTYAVAPLGVRAMSKGLVRPVIGVSAVLVAVSIGVTVPSPSLAT